MAINYTYKPYEEDEETRRRRAALEAAEASKPAAYSGSYASAVDEALRKIQNREKFSYDVNADALYQQYKDSYTRQGKLAMEDTIGKAAALTGGYGNSYAQTAGQQTYQAYLDKLNDRIPELYAAAYDRYRQEGEDLKDEYAMLSAREQQEYARHRDAVDDYYKDLSYKQSAYGDAYERGYGQYSDEQNRLYQLALAAQDQENTDRAFAESKRQYEESKAASAAKLAEDARQANMEYELALKKLDEKNNGTAGADGANNDGTAGADGGADIDFIPNKEIAKVIKENWIVSGTVEDGVNALEKTMSHYNLTEEEKEKYTDMLLDRFPYNKVVAYLAKIKGQQQSKKVAQQKKANDIYLQGQIGNGLWY